ncbi:MAG: hypothetical protein WAP03_13655 [Methylorubrum rhodinum]|uniref:hypothetical protein n=1 Tax=Methylorubrum rhodinum TaxID=29428 RepID=UPI003BAE95A6
MAFGEAQSGAPDLTLTLDVAEIWPDPMDCPDWPLQPMFAQNGAGICGERDAIQQLERLACSLARSQVLREPTAEERATMKARYFREFDPKTDGERAHLVGPWSLSLGLRGIGPRSHVEETIARQIVEGVHMRGYLRKLRVAAELREQAAADAERRRLEADVSGYPGQSAALLEELSGLREAEERHRQRLADEIAVNRAYEIRMRLRDVHEAASRAARKLGVQAPPLPPLPEL